MRNSNEHDESLFYCDIDENETTRGFVNHLQEYSINNSKQVYILKKALGTSKEYLYDLTDVAVILIPKHPILILNYGSATPEKLEDFKLDFIEDIGSISDKFDYNKVLGRARKWPVEFFKTETLTNFDINSYINEEIDSKYHRNIDLLISLLIGSINSIDKIGITEPNTLLDKVKQKIILFDGQQSRFIYQARNQKTIAIQGMAGTGKTELLLHKLKDIYSSEKDSIIAFTCHNKVLANDMKQRIPQFFNFLKVEEQIEWDKRLHVFPGWGSANIKNSGLYSYICINYHIPFITYRENHNFDSICFSVLEKLNGIENFEPCFDYIFIDESQDFKEGFLELCKKVTKKTVYIAGDIFQNIFDSSVDTNIKPDFLLNKCYRTDPKTLMFAHAVGMGLYETPKINWLDDEAWLACGYIFDRNKKENTFSISRNPLRRFEDLNATDTIRMSMSNSEAYSNQILASIEEIRCENPTVTPEDIAVIILGDYNTLCKIADETALLLNSKYNWSSSKGYETKIKERDKVYISNVNNVKGLEFPFVICVVPKFISSNILVRNSIYMALTRSFLTSYFIIDEQNKEFYDLYKSAIKKIAENGKMDLCEPTDEERKEMANQIQITLSAEKKTFAQIMDELFDNEYPHIERDMRTFITNTIGKVAGKISEEQIKQRTRLFIESVLGGDEL